MTYLPDEHIFVKKSTTGGIKIKAAPTKLKSSDAADQQRLEAWASAAIQKACADISTNRSLRDNFLHEKACHLNEVVNACGCLRDHARSEFISAGVSLGKEFPRKKVEAKWVKAEEKMAGKAKYPDGWTGAKTVHKSSVAAAAERDAEDAKAIAFAQKVVASSLVGTHPDAEPVRRYLKFRGLDPALAQFVRYNDACPTNYSVDPPKPHAIIFPAVNIKTGEVRGFAMIALQGHEDGSVREMLRKGTEEKWKQSLGRTGGCAFVVGDLSKSETVINCEGAVTALTNYAATSFTALATFSNSTIGTPEMPDHIKTVIIHGEHGSEKFATAAVAGYEGKGLRSWPVFTPDKSLSDSNDVLRAHGMDAVKAMFAIHEDEGPIPLVPDVGTPDPFPMSALGDLEAVALAIEKLTHAPRSMCSIAALSAANYAVQHLIDIEFPSGQGPIPSSLYFMTVARSGERKTSIERLASKGIKRRQDDMARTYAKEAAHASARIKIWEKLEKGMLSEKDDAPGLSMMQKIDLQAGRLAELGPKPLPAPHAVLVLEDFTTEGLQRALRNGHPSLMVATTEAGVIVGGHAMRDETTKQFMHAAFNNIWDGKAISITRAAESISISGRRLCVNFALHPHLAVELFADQSAEQSGFLGRCLIAWPESTIGTRPFDEEPDAAAMDEVAAFGTRIHSLLSIDPTRLEGNGTSAPGMDPSVLTLDAGARKVWSQLGRKMEVGTKVDGAFFPVANLANKLTEQACRIAATLATFENHRATTISAEVMGRAVDIAEWFLEQALLIKSSNSHGVEIAAAETLRRWLADTWTEDNISIRAITRNGPNAVRKNVDAAVSTLVKNRWLKPIPGGGIVKGKRAAQAWAIVREAA